MNRPFPAAIAFALTSLPALALADVDVTFSDGVKRSLGGDPNASDQETQLEDAIDDTLEGIADGSVRVRNGDAPEGTTREGLRDLARRLHASNQRIRILCREEARELGKSDPVMRRLYEQSEVTPLGGGAATHGDFDAQGNPRPNGTMIMVIECARLLNGWFLPVFEGGDTMLHTLGHELVHGGHRGNVHGGNEADEPYYDAFGDLFQRVGLRMHARNERDKNKREREPKSEKTPKEKVARPSGEKGGKGKVGRIGTEPGGGAGGKGGKGKQQPKPETPPCEEEK